MRNPIHKRLENLTSWQHLTFMVCLCERMLPNFQLFCAINQSQDHIIFQNILNLVWEYLTVKDAKINFENQLEKLENVIPDINQFDCYGVFPAEDACQALAELLHSLIAGATLEQSIKISKLSFRTVVDYLQTLEERSFSELELKNHPEIEQELDIQWQIYRLLKSCEERNISLILDLKNEIRSEGISNIGLKFSQ